jgi:hypothetical protein
MSDRFFMHGQFDPAVQIPSNLILAMGLSSLTMLAAKGVTTSYAESGLVQKPENGPEAEAKSGSKSNPEVKGGLFLDDEGKPDLSKIQIMGWTFIALGVFVGMVINTISTSALPQGLPNIDSTVLALMGIGQGAYVGKKLATKDDPDAPRLAALLPEKGEKGKPVKITGVNFKDYKSGSLITIDGKPCDIAFDQKDNIWKDGEITFKLPDKKPDGTEMKGDIKIGLMVGDKKSVNELEFKVT